MIVTLIIINFISKLTNTLIEAERFINEREKERDRIVKSFEEIAVKMTNLNRLWKNNTL